MAIIIDQPIGDVIPLSEPVIYKVKGSATNIIQMSMQITFLNDSLVTEELFTDRIIEIDPVDNKPIFIFELTGALQDRILKYNKDFCVEGQVEVIETDNVINFSYVFFEFVQVAGELIRLQDQNADFAVEVTELFPALISSVNDKVIHLPLLSGTDPLNIIGSYSQSTFPAYTTPTLEPAAAGFYIFSCTIKAEFYDYGEGSGGAFTSGGGGDVSFNIGSNDLFLTPKITYFSETNFISYNINTPNNPNPIEETLVYSGIIYLDPDEADNAGSLPPDIKLYLRMESANFGTRVKYNEVDFRIDSAQSFSNTGIDKYFKPYEKVRDLVAYGNQDVTPRKFLTNMPMLITTCRGKKVCVPFILRGSNNQLVVTGYNGAMQVFQVITPLEDVIYTLTSIGDNAFRTICLGGAYGVPLDLPALELNGADIQTGWDVAVTGLQNTPNVIDPNDFTGLRFNFFNASSSAKYINWLQFMAGSFSEITIDYKFDVHVGGETAPAIGAAVQTTQRIGLGYTPTDGSDPFVDIPVSISPDYGIFLGGFGAGTGHDISYQPLTNPQKMAFLFENGDDINVKMRFTPISNQDGFNDVANSEFYNVILTVDYQDPNDATILHTVNVSVYSNPASTEWALAVGLHTVDNGTFFEYKEWRVAIARPTIELDFDFNVNIIDYANNIFAASMVLNGENLTEGNGGLTFGFDNVPYGANHFPEQRRLCWSAYYPLQCILHDLEYTINGDKEVFSLNEGTGFSTSYTNDTQTLQGNFNPTGNDIWVNTGKTQVIGSHTFTGVPVTETSMDLVVLPVAGFKAAPDYDYFRPFASSINDDYDCIKAYVAMQDDLQGIYSENFDGGNAVLAANWDNNVDQALVEAGIMFIDFAAVSEYMETTVGDLVNGTIGDRLLKFDYSIRDLTGSIGAGALVGRCAHQADNSSAFSGILGGLGNQIYLNLGSDLVVSNTGEVGEALGLRFEPITTRQVLMRWSWDIDIEPDQEDVNSQPEITFSITWITPIGVTPVQSGTLLFEAQQGVNGINNFVFEHNFVAEVGKVYSFGAVLSNPPATSIFRNYTTLQGTKQEVFEGTTGGSQTELSFNADIIYPDGGALTTVISGTPVNGYLTGQAAIPFDIFQNLPPISGGGAGNDFKLSFKAAVNQSTQVGIDNIIIQEGLAGLTPVSEEITIKQIDCCDDNLRLWFLNSFGFYDPVTVKIERQELDVDSEKFYNAQDLKFDIENGGTLRSRSTGRRVYRVVTEDLPDNYVDWLEELLVTVDCYIELDSDTLIPVTPKDGTIQQSETDKGQIYLKFKLEYSNQIVTQRR